MARGTGTRGPWLALFAVLFPTLLAFRSCGDGVWLFHEVFAGFASSTSSSAIRRRLPLDQRRLLIQQRVLFPVAQTDRNGESSIP